jgi:CubicO group peptidase (beta-lactamase class C family)
MTRTPLRADTTAALSSALRDRRRAHRVPALSAAVARGGEVAWADAVGWVSLDGEAASPATAFRVGSITKPMTAVAVLRLVAAGRVGLNDPVGRHLPDAPAADATTAQLLMHTSGLAAEPTGPWWERHGGCTWDELVAMDLPSLWEPGERFHYSNVGFAVLGRLVEEAHGRPWDDVLRDELWEPLGMGSTGRVPRGPHATGYAVHPHAELVLAEPVSDYLAMGPAGEVWSTPTDLARFGAWLAGGDDLGSDDLAGDDVDPVGVLPLEWRRRMTTPRFAVDSPGAPFTAARGLGVRVSHEGGRRTVGHGGSVPGFQAQLLVDAATGDAVAVCGSSTAGFGDARDLLDVLDEREPSRRTDEPASGGPVSADLLTLVGTWYWGPMPYVVAVDRSGSLQLKAVADDGRGTAFERAGDRWVGVEDGYWLGETLRPVERDGRVVALDVGTFCFTRTPYDPAAGVPGGLDAAGWQPVPTS